MDVDVDNFEEAIGILEMALPKVCFVAIDLEMTGISAGPETEMAPGDTPQEQYMKGLSVVNRPFNIVQIGLCLFTELQARESFECRSFSFYVFPRPVEERSDAGIIKEDYYVGIKSSTVTFLQENNIDLGRWLSKGISYTSPKIEEDLLSLLQAQQDRLETGVIGDEPPSLQRSDKPEATSPADIQMVQAAMNKVETMVKNNGSETQLPGMNSFLALIVRQRIAEEYPSVIVEKRPSVTTPNGQDRWAVSMTEEKRKERIEDLRRRTLQYIGFRRVWKMLKQRRAPIVVHNGFLDLLFLSAALEPPLPMGLTEWKEQVHGIFPHIFDTKLLAETPPFKGRLGERSALPQLSERLEQLLQRRTPKAVAGTTANETPSGHDGACGSTAPPPRVILPLSFVAPHGFTFDDGSGWHSAGFDAFKTGQIFAYYRYVMHDDQVLLEHCNRIFLMKSAFHLRLAEASDHLALDGVARYARCSDAGLANNTALLAMLKPILKDGQVKVSIRWCSADSRAFLLVFHGSPDVVAGAAGRRAFEECVDRLLEGQRSSDRLDFRTVEDHIAHVIAECCDYGMEDEEEGGEQEEADAEKEEVPKATPNQHQEAGRGGEAQEEPQGSEPPAKRKRPSD